MTKKEMEEERTKRENTTIPYIGITRNCHIHQECHSFNSKQIFLFHLTTGVKTISNDC